MCIRHRTRGVEVGTKGVLFRYDWREMGLFVPPLNIICDKPTEIPKNLPP